MNGTWTRGHNQRGTVVTHYFMVAGEPKGYVKDWGKGGECHAVWGMNDDNQGPGLLVAETVNAADGMRALELFALSR